MTLVKWVPKETVSARKLNNNGLRRAAIADLVAIADEDRLAGDIYYISDDGSLNIYQSGSGATFKVSQISNYIFDQRVNIGIGGTKTNIYDKQIINRRGLSNNKVFFFIEYTQYVSLASDIEVQVTDGTTTVTGIVSPGSTGTPTKQYQPFVLSSNAFAIDDEINLKVNIKNATVHSVEMRSM